MLRVDEVQGGFARSSWALLTCAAAIFGCGSAQGGGDSTAMSDSGTTADAGANVVCVYQEELTMICATTTPVPPWWQWQCSAEPCSQVTASNTFASSDDCMTTASRRNLHQLTMTCAEWAASNDAGAPVAVDGGVGVPVVDAGKDAPSGPAPGADSGPGPVDAGGGGPGSVDAGGGPHPTSDAGK